MSEKENRTSRFVVMTMLAVVSLVAMAGVHLGGFLTMENRPTTAQAVEASFANHLKDRVAPQVGRVRGRLGLPGNKVVQRGDELYFLPDLDHLTAPSFLRADHGVLSHVVLKREAEGTARVRHPIPAVVKFAQQLEERGVSLVLLPTPSKGMFSNGQIVRNSGFSAFVETVEKEGVIVVDVAPEFQRLKKEGVPIFLRTDSHWTPQAMSAAAVQVMDVLREAGLGERPRDGGYRIETLEHVRLGDLGRLLGREPEVVKLWGVSRNGRPWEVDPDSDLLLLGDSFSNVFSSETEDNWTAGFAEALTAARGQAVDRIARDGGGALASRKDLMAQPERLRGKKVVVWQFAARELSFGDWQVLPWAERPEVVAEPGSEGTWEGTIAAVAPIPSLKKTPYRWATMEIHLREVRGEGAPSELVLMAPAVLDRVPTAMIKWKPGQKIEFDAEGIIPDRVQRWQRFPLPDVNFSLINLPRAWMRVDSE